MAFVDELRATNDVERLVTLSLLDRTPHVFGADTAAWSAWKHGLAVELDVDPHAIVLVGSAAVGVSLSPLKGFKPFHAGSDIDVAIISTPYFDTAWWYLRTLGPRYHSLPADVRTVVDEQRSTYVYWATIATDRLIGWLPFGRRWLEASVAAAARSPINGRRVTFRLYRDAAALRQYQTRSFAGAQTRLIAPVT